MPFVHSAGFNPGRKQRRGIVLLAVLVVIVLLTLAAYQYSEFMLAEYKAADSYTRSAQARALADSGVHYVAALLSDPNNVTNILNGNPTNNPTAFMNIPVGSSDQPRLQGRFSIITLLNPDDPNFASQPYNFGVTDESGKINLNALLQLDSSGQVAHDMLMKLAPATLTEDIINSMLDWIDPDDEPRSNGAESQYYSSLSPAYRCKNAPLDSLEELLLVKGMTPQLLFGNDRNRNGVLEPDEDDGTGQVNLGLAPYLTVYSREQNVDSQGNPRIYINDNDLNTLYTNLQTALGDELATYIVAYRVYGPAPSTSGRGGVSTRPAASGASGGPSGRPQVSRGSLTSSGRRPQSISSLYALINSSVSIPGGTPGAQATTLPSPLNDPSALQQLLPLLLDKTTTTRATEIPARININTASQTVLSTLPGLQPADVQAIINARPSPTSTDQPDPIFQTTAWLITQANIKPETLQALEKYITARSQVYRVQAIGYFDGDGPTARIEAVIDTNNGRPRIVYWRDLTQLGRGFNLNTQQ